MEDFIEENPRKDEKKAFYVGLITLTALILIVGLTIFFIRGCSEKTENVKEVKEGKTEDVAKTVTTQTANPNRKRRRAKYSSPSDTNSFRKDLYR
jgi:flagellar basal body-associated protein FliL